MQKLFVLFVLIIILAFSVFVPMAAAQTTESAGCTSTDSLFDSGLGPYTFGPYSYLASERITFTFAGTVTSSFGLSVNGVIVNPSIISPMSVDYGIPADGTYTFDIMVTNGSAGTSVTVDCLASDEVPTYAPGTICHIPPGNPNAAHTITVGLSAVEAHLAHGDTEGPCPAGIETEYTNDNLGIAIFIIYATGEIQIYGDCDEEGNCSEMANVPIAVVINFNIIVISTDGNEGEDDDGEFVDVENPEDFGFELPDSDPSDGITVVIYYLHPDPANSSVGVFQINVYQNGVLVDDNVLLFITTDGTIILWTDQNVWDERLEASLEAQN